MNLMPIFRTNEFHTAAHRITPAAGSGCDYVFAARMCPMLAIHLVAKLVIAVREWRAMVCFGMAAEFAVHCAA